MNEISARGPIACTVAVPASFQNYTGGIYQDTTGIFLSNFFFNFVHLNCFIL